MHQPSAVWSTSTLVVFDRDISMAQNIVLSQGRSALAATISRCARLIELANHGPLENAGYHPEMSSVLSDLCYQAGLASTILFADGARGRNESPNAFALRKERVRYVKSFVENISFKLRHLPDRDLRNSLTHIDERLGDWLTKRPGVGWLIDSAIWNHLELKQPEPIEVAYCRCYFMETREIAHLAHRVSVELLSAECQYVLAVVFGVPMQQPEA